MDEHAREIERARKNAEENRRYWQLRAESQLSFAEALLSRMPDLGSSARRALEGAERLHRERLVPGAVADLPAITMEIENELAPFAAAAKGFAVYCVGHAHIDMNWMWGWQETAAVTNDTFTTVVKLLDEFPRFVFSQSQASVYRILEEHNPRVFHSVKELVRRGRIEVTASHWVETDKNMVSGEALCRHLLYTREYMSEAFGLEPEDVPVDWSPDTFGHAHSVPGYLVRGGVKYLYLHRPGAHGALPRPEMFTWRGLDGSTVLVRNDMALGYNGRIGPRVMEQSLLRAYDRAGTPFVMFVYGVGDHGGGPTRRDLRMMTDMAEWPVFPEVLGAKSVDYFRRLEEHAAGLPVLDGELNFEFTGCYTTQSLIKKVNSYGQRKMVEAETASTFAGSICERPYPFDGFRTHWRNTLFHHFHDILPGSGVHDTRTYTHGLYQQTMAFTGITTTEALRDIAARIDTRNGERLVSAPLPDSEPMSMGGGVGKGSVNGGLSVYGVSDGKTAPVYAIYNLGQFPRAEVVRLNIWDIDPAGVETIEAAAADGTALPCQLFEKGDYWGHTFATFAVPVSVQGLGYTTVTLREGGGAERDEKADRSGGAYQKGFGHECSYASYERSPEGLENEFLDLELDTITGGIRSLVHRESGTELVRSGAALLEYSVERAKPMSAWQVEHHSGALEPKVVAMKRGARGPNVATIEVTVSVESSRFTITYRLERNDPRLYIDISGTWMECGDDRKGSPTLTFALPTSLTDVRTVYEIPFGSIERDLRHGEEVPALRWAHVTGMIGNGTAGVLVVSDCKHGFSFDCSTLRLTLIRSAFEPDPLPEIGRHDVRIAVVPHAGAMTRIDEARHAVSATEPLLVVQTDAHDGGLPADGRFLEIEGGAVLSCVKRRNTGGGIVVRLYNPSDAPMKAGIGFGSAMGRAVAKATALDVLEREIGALPVSKGKVSVGLDPHAIVTLSIE